jgi:hypothetical protein
MILGDFSQFLPDFRHSYALSGPEKSREFMLPLQGIFIVGAGNSGARQSELIDLSHVAF